MDLDALETATPLVSQAASSSESANMMKKDGKDGTSTTSSKKTVREVIAGLDPTVRVDTDVEDVRLHTFF